MNGDTVRLIKGGRERSVGAKGLSGYLTAERGEDFSMAIFGKRIGRDRQFE
jgi:hypothetical protein